MYNHSEHWQEEKCQHTAVKHYNHNTTDQTTVEQPTHQTNTVLWNHWNHRAANTEQSSITVMSHTSQHDVTDPEEGGPVSLRCHRPESLGTLWTAEQSYCVTGKLNVTLIAFWSNCAPSHPAEEPTHMQGSPAYWCICEKKTKYNWVFTLFQYY